MMPAAAVRAADWRGAAVDDGAELGVTVGLTTRASYPVPGADWHARRIPCSNSPGGDSVLRNAAYRLPVTRPSRAGMAVAGPPVELTPAGRRRACRRAGTRGRP